MWFFTYYERGEMKKLLNDILTEIFPLLESQGFRPSPFEGDDFGKIKYARSLCYSYTFLKIKDPHFVFITFQIFLHRQYAEIRPEMSVFKITELPECIDELKGYKSLFDSGAYILLRQGIDFGYLFTNSPFKLSYDTCTEFFRKRNIKRLRRRLYETFSDTDKLIQRYFKSIKGEDYRKFFEKALLNRFGFLVKDARVKEKYWRIQNNYIQSLNEWYDKEKLDYIINHK